MQKSYTVEEAKRKMEHYCAYQERCHDEVVLKLKSLNMIPQAIDVIVVHLLDNNYLNEERFACSFARGKFRIKHWGKRRITNELKTRNISRYNIERALKEIPEGEYLDAFHELADKQWEITRESNIQKKKKKVMDYLLRKGYESNLVQEKIYAFE
ncbi:regulatory protein RecX [Flavobacterium sp. AG291]|uniref:regulatory protein RecX n=1 Tax=Flavobacterium sp. AG291 TaxID=2184000 RepID=UPI000E0AD5B5|nr:regulatory protein RecX [Flavobacterium sp. AG291]RDI08605.1 regulatory protein [Flavobacterium sp. AG291]